MRLPDLTVAVRNVVRRPVFALTAVLLIALGAGANAAVFSVVRGVLLRPLSFSEPERLVAFWPGQFFSNEELEYFRSHTRTLESIAAHAPGWMMALTSPDGEPLKVTGAKVSDNLFQVLGARPAIGRVIEPGDARTNAPRVAVLSDGLWRRRFGANPSAVGQIVDLDQEQHTIVGVMPFGFEVFEPGTDVWVAMPWAPGQNGFKTVFNQGIARQSPGATIESVTRELQAIVPAMRRDLSRDQEWGQTLHVASLRDTITGEVRPTLLILLGAVGLMLVLAATNLATLVLGRSVERVREMAVRTALGASRRRLVAQLVTEQAVLACGGAVTGVALAYAALPLLVARIPPEVPRVGQIALDWTVLATVLAVSVGVAVTVGLLPALLAARPSLQPVLRQTHTTDTRGRRRVLSAMVATQVALAVVLGIGATLMIRSLWSLHRVDPGFRPDGVLTFRLQTTSKYRALSTGLPYLERMVERLSAMPGVARVGAIAHPPLGGYAWTIQVRREDQSLPPGAAMPQVGWRFIGWDYFQAMGIAFRHGRAFTSADTLKAPLVAVVNETFARRFFGRVDAAVGGTIIQNGGGRPGEERVQVVGVVADVRHLGLDKAPVAELFRPMAQTFMFPMAIVLRASVPPSQLAASVRQAAFEIDPAIPVAELQPYTTLIADTLGRPRLLGFLLMVFALAGLLLGFVGIYGVAAYRVRQREREIGIRLALGAEPSRVSGAVLAQGALYALAGVVAGLPIAWVVARAMSSVIFGITPHDPATFIALPAFLVAVALAASYLPARRAAQVDPVLTMRAE